MMRQKDANDRQPPGNETAMDRARRRALRIAGIYAVCGLLWIALSDRLLASLVGDGAALTTFQTYKGWLFIIITAALVFLLTRQALQEPSRLAEELRTGELRYRTLFESLDAAVLLMRGPLCVECNPATLKLFGLSTRDEIIGKTPTDFAPATQPDGRDSAELVRWNVEQALAKGSHIFEWQAFRKGGEPFFMEVRFTPYLIGGEQYFQCIAIDITERKRTEQEIAERRALLQQIMDTASVAIFLVNKDGRITHANRRMAEMFGMAPEDLTGCEYVDLVHPSEREIGRQKMLALLASEIQSVDLERHYRRKDGSGFWGHLAGKRFHDVQGRDIGLIGVISDVTERRRAETLLRESETRLNTILDNVGAAIFIKDMQYRYTYVNRRVTEVFGLRTEDILGRSDDAFFSGPSVEEVRKSDRPVIERGETVAREEAGLTTADGTPRTYWTVKLPLRDGSGAVTGLCGISTDITERKTSEKALAENRRFLETIIESAPT